MFSNCTIVGWFGCRACIVLISLRFCCTETVQWQIVQHVQGLHSAADCRSIVTHEHGCVVTHACVILRHSPKRTKRTLECKQVSCQVCEPNPGGSTFPALNACVRYACRYPYPKSGVFTNTLNHTHTPTLLCACIYIRAPPREKCVCVIRKPGVVVAPA